MMGAERTRQNRSGCTDAFLPCLHAAFDDSVSHRDDIACNFYDCAGEDCLEKPCLSDADEVTDLTRTAWCRQHHQRGSLCHRLDDDHTGCQWISREVPSVERTILRIGSPCCHTNARDNIRRAVDEEKRISLRQEFTYLFRSQPENTLRLYAFL